MYQISDQQIDLILTDLLQRGIETESMRMNLLDHICILIEGNLEEDGDFNRFYSTVIRSFYKKELRELEEEARLLITMQKGHILISRSWFFFGLFVLLIGPFIIYDLLWYVQYGATAGWLLPQEIWVSTFIFALDPLLIFLVLYLTPDRCDPLIPRNARVMLGFRPLIRIVPVDMAG